MKILPSPEVRVYLLGAGPGSPDLITLRGKHCLELADVVIYDRLVDQRLLDFVPAAAKKIFAGKKGGHYNFDQEKINALLLKYARKSLRVVRLKGGDPFLFGRGGEEALFLVRENIPFEVIPGVSSALGVLSAAGIPVTHRGYSSSIKIVTGHLRSNSKSSDRWNSFAPSSETLIVLMPLGNLRYIVSQLILRGWSLDTPTALIESGTLENERKITAPLHRILADSIKNNCASPSLLVVGKVVQLGEKLERGLKTSIKRSSTPVTWERKKSS